MDGNRVVEKERVRKKRQGVSCFQCKKKNVLPEKFIGYEYIAVGYEFAAVIVTITTMVFVYLITILKHAHTFNNEQCFTISRSAANFIVIIHAN